MVRKSVQGVIARAVSLAVATLSFATVTASPSGAVCSPYRTSGPIVVRRNNQIIENVIIRSTNGPGIHINGYSGVQIKNVVIHHNRGPGIEIENASNVTIISADIVFDGARASGPNPSADYNNIDCYNSPYLKVRNVRLTRGSTGIYMNRCTINRLSRIEGHDHRGPFPRGQLVQWDKSNNGVLADFSTENPIQKSWTEDNVNVYETEGITIMRGLVDGNNSPSGQGVLVDGDSGNVVVQDVDAVRQSNGCFGVYGGGGHDVTFTNTRCRDTICALPRGEPLSNSLGWSIDPESVRGNLHVVNASHMRLCNPTNIVWDRTMLSTADIRARSFVARPPIRVRLCRYGY